MDNNFSNQSHHRLLANFDGTNIPNSQYNLNPFPNTLAQTQEQFQFFYFLFLQFKKYTNSNSQTDLNNLSNPYIFPGNPNQINEQTDWWEASQVTNPHFINSASHDLTSGDDLLLPQEKSSYTPSETYTDYENRCSEFQSTGKDCSKKFCESSDSTTKRNVCNKKTTKKAIDWNEERDRNLQEAVIRYKKDWSKVEKYFKKIGCKFTIHALKNRHKMLEGNPIQLRVKFSRQEDLKIAHLFSKYGTDWDEIAKQFTDRNKQMIKNRYYSHINKRGLLESLLMELKQSGSSAGSFDTMDFQNYDQSLSTLVESPRSESKIKNLSEGITNFDDLNLTLSGELNHKITPYMEC